MPGERNLNGHRWQKQESGPRPLFFILCVATPKDLTVHLTEVRWRPHGDHHKSLPCASFDRRCSRPERLDAS